MVSEWYHRTFRLPVLIKYDEDDKSARFILSDKVKYIYWINFRIRVHGLGFCSTHTMYVQNKVCLMTNILTNNFNDICMDDVEDRRLQL